MTEPNYDDAPQSDNPFRSMQAADAIQQDIWRKEAELSNLERKKKESRRASRVLRGAFLFVAVFCFLVLAIAIGFWQIVAGIGTVAAGFCFLLTFLPNSTLTEEQGELEAELYVLRNRWNQTMLG